MVAGVIAAGLSVARAQLQPILPSTPSNTQVAKAAVIDASGWTHAKWSGMKAKWSLDKVKWADCRERAKARGLAGRKSWSLVANCMVR